MNNSTPPVRDTWEDWVLYLLEAVEQTAGQTIHTMQAIKTAVAYLHRATR